ncbi:ABC-type sugar transport system, ATPase component [Acidovorax sp. MR-S7]|nr:ABC-type sugar transport system, ATPase component [Acidovorax sp. MR-S7]
MKREPVPMREAVDAPSSGLGAPSTATTLFQLSGVSKSYFGSRALDGVDFDLRAGEVHVLFGENGAGKSTLINILVGTVTHDAGEIAYQGKPLERGRWNPHVARSRGVSAVFQEFSLVPTMSVTENLFLGREIKGRGLLRQSEMEDKARALLAQLCFAIPAGALVASLSRAQQQMVEIAKALLGDPQVLILDEPTASLTEAETDVLFSLIGTLKARGVGIVYVSHRMKEIRRLADRITVLRDGRRIDTVSAGEVTDGALVQLMVGRPIDVLYPQIEHCPGALALRAWNITTANGTVRDANIEVASGEVVGIAGLVGGGKSELARAVFGLEPLTSGEVWVDGRRVARLTPEALLRRGLCYFPADRVAEGLALTRTVTENATITATRLPQFGWGPFLNRRAEKGLADQALSRLNLLARTGATDVIDLSGGNRQKVMLARGLVRPTRIFLFDEPTVGIDVGAKLEIYRAIKELAEGGAAVLMVSSDLPEILHLCRRAYVVHRGALAAHLVGDELTESRVLNHFFPADQVHAQEGLLT